MLFRTFTLSSLAANNQSSLGCNPPPPQTIPPVAFYEHTAPRKIATSTLTSTWLWAWRSLYWCPYVDWVVQALSKSSALPVLDPAGGGRARGGGSGGDTWRDDSDEEDDQDQEPLDQVCTAVL